MHHVAAACARRLTTSVGRARAVFGWPAGASARPSAVRTSRASPLPAWATAGATSGRACLLNLFLLFVSKDFLETAFDFLFDFRDLLLLLRGQFNLLPYMWRKHPAQLKAAGRTAVWASTLRILTRR